MSLLSDDEIDSRLKDLDGWARDGDRIRRECSLADFVKAVEFTNRLVDPAEEANHHPDLEVSWGQVVISLMTHDEGGLTDKDFELAETYETIYRKEFSDE